MKVKKKANTDPKQRYLRYLRSRAWRAVRQAVFRRDGHRCTICGSTVSIQPHHTTYRHVFNEMEHLEDLVTLCDTHHKKAHKKMGSLFTSQTMSDVNETARMMS